MILVSEKASGSTTTPQHDLGTVWGLDVVALHDRVWASRGIQVIRPNEGAIASSRPALYLLLDEHHLVSFDVRPVLKQLHWQKPRAVRIRVRSGRPSEYREIVHTDACGRFQGVQREYTRTFHDIGRCWLTPDRRVATRWACAGTAAAAVREIRATIGRDHRSHLVVDGEIADRRNEAAATEWFENTVGQWNRMTAVLDDVYQFSHSVWVHETSRIAPGVRFVGPVWVGAGVVIDQATVVVGPVAIPDRQWCVSPARDVNWDLVVTPRWRLAPRLRWGRTRRVSKRLFDIVFSSVVLLATLPMYPFVIGAILLEDGWPPFFAHRRQSIGGRLFPCYKFRTMCQDAELLKARLVAANVCDGPQFYLQDDPRLLRVGKFMRRYQIDELPQFFNVLLGHMSIVGPRPSPDSENQCCPAWREARLSVRPGVTGLWQIRRTREPQTDFQEWIRYDLQYVQSESWKMDIWIILQTIKKVIAG
ncbi:MAG: sugar transferase [Planctomycetes bacterium]|nr:sugar transferase [Planctomycetota bacterium]